MNAKTIVWQDFCSHPYFKPKQAIAQLKKKEIFDPFRPKGMSKTDADIGFKQCRPSAASHYTYIASQCSCK